MLTKRFLLLYSSEVPESLFCFDYSFSSAETIQIYWLVLKGELSMKQIFFMFAVPNLITFLQNDILTFDLPVDLLCREAQGRLERPTQSFLCDC